MTWMMIILIVAVDQLSKYLVVQKIGPHEVIQVIPGFFDLIYRENRGAAWSFLADADWGILLLKMASLLAAILFSYILLKTKHDWLRWAMVLMIAGTIGNGIDRWMLGYVVDFLSFTFGSYVFPTFNVADSVLVAGTIAFAGGMIFIPHEEQFAADLFVGKKKDKLKPKDGDVKDE